MLVYIQLSVTIRSGSQLVSLIQFFAVGSRSLLNFFLIGFMALHGERVLARHPLLVHLHQEGTHQPDHAVSPGKVPLSVVVQYEVRPWMTRSCRCSSSLSRSILFEVLGRFRYGSGRPRAAVILSNRASSKAMALGASSWYRSMSWFFRVGTP